MNMDRDRILDKIKKCLALSQSSEPAEAASALRQAQKMMELHGISQADVGRAQLGSAQVKSKASVSRIKDWELSLLSMTAKAFGCRLMWTNSSSYAKDVFGTYTLIGLKHQVELAQYTCHVMQRKLIKARQQFVAELPERGREYKTRQADGFCHGWIQAVAKTVHDFALPDEAKQLIEDELARLAPLKAKVKERAIGAEGFYAGREAGSGESIHRPLNERDPVLQIGG
jgi:hypothetical protein